MNYDSLSRNTVKITLSEEDMREYSLCAESIALHTGETKRNLSRLLREMKLFPGYRPERLFLEAFPVREGGCVLYVSALGTEYEDDCYEKNRDEKTPLMCTVKSIRTISLICFGLKLIAEEPSVFVYRMGGVYAVVVISEAHETEKIRHFLSEYSDVRDNLTEIYSLPEYAEPVCTENACELFAGLY